MKIFFSQKHDNTMPITEELSPLSLQDSIEKTRQALDIAYAGFDNAVETDLVDSYIYEIKALQKRYEHLTALCAAMEAAEPEPSDQHSPIRTLVSHVFS